MSLMEKLNKKTIILGVLVLLILGVGGVVISKFFSNDANFSTEFYTAMKSATNVGTYKFTISIDKGAELDKTVSENKSYKEVKKEAENSKAPNDEIEQVSPKSSNFSNSWVTADGLRKSKTNTGAERIDFNISGTTYSIKPLEASGEITLSTSNATQSGLKLLGYYVKDNIVYLDLSQTRQALLTSGNEDLIKYGKSFPDFASVMKFEKDELILDNINDPNQSTQLNGFNYVTFRKEFLRALSVVLDSSYSGLDEANCFSVQDTKYYATVNSDNSEAFQGVIKSLSASTDSMYQSYLKKLETDNVVNEKQLSAKSQAISKISNANKELLDKVLDFAKSKDFQVVNWVRNTSNGSEITSEISLQATGVVNNRTYLMSITGESDSSIAETDKIKLPSGAINYRKAMDTDDSLVLSEFIGKLKDIKNKSLDEIKSELSDDTDIEDDGLSSIDITADMNK